MLVWRNMCSSPVYLQDNLDGKAEIACPSNKTSEGLNHIEVDLSVGQVQPLTLETSVLLEQNSAGSYRN